MLFLRSESFGRTVLPYCVEFPWRKEMKDLPFTRKIVNLPTVSEIELLSTTPAKAWSVAGLCKNDNLENYQKEKFRSKNFSFADFAD